VKSKRRTGKIRKIKKNKKMAMGSLARWMKFTTKSNDRKRPSGKSFNAQTGGTQKKTGQNKTVLTGP